MADAATTPRLTFVEAEKKARFADQLTDGELGQVWREFASKISYHHADDSGKEWGEARALKPALQALDLEHDRRGIARPSRSGFLL